MGDVWRALAAETDVDLKVVVAVHRQEGTEFVATDVLRGLDYTLVDAEEDFDPSTLGFTPDVVFSVGWHAKPCRAVVTYASWKAVPKICCFDLPWRRKLRCLVAPLVLGRFLRGYSAAFVPGEACARYAKWLGFRAIYRGLFSIDVERFGRRPDGADRRPEVRDHFLYIGRNSDEKRIGDLRAAYRLYRECGGKLGLKLHGKGLEDGFLAPDRIPGAMREAAAVILPSAFDPWPLTLLEAMSAGCPVIASDRCMNRLELGKNWRVFRCGDVEALAGEMARMEREGLSEAAREENLELARQYDCSRWVGRVREVVFK